MFVHGFPKKFHTEKNFVKKIIKNFKKRFKKKCKKKTIIKYANINTTNLTFVDTV